MTVIESSTDPPAVPLAVPTHHRLLTNDPWDAPPNARQLLTQYFNTFG